MLVQQKETTIKPLLDCLSANETEFSQLYEKAQNVTSEHFGKTRSLFNPIYVSDICLADCPYCGYRISNKSFTRKILKPYEVAQEAIYLNNRGIKNILVLAGDFKHSKYVQMLAESIKTIQEKASVDWLGIEVATLEIYEYAILWNAGAQSVTVFQETYNRRRYDQLHENMQFKGDFDFRFNAQERAIKAGFSEVGFGALYGIGFWKDDTIAMVEHALELKIKYPTIKLRFSFPRLQISMGQSENCRTEEISKQQLIRAIVGIRLTFPEATLVLTGRETIKFLCTQASIVNALGYSGSTSVGGYTKLDNGMSQFSLDSQDTFNDFTNSLKANGFRLHS